MSRNVLWATCIIFISPWVVENTRLNMSHLEQLSSGNFAKGIFFLFSGNEINKSRGYFWPVMPDIKKNFGAWISPAQKLYRKLKGGEN